jgi:hypothetical protein
MCVSRPDPSLIISLAVCRPGKSQVYRDFLNSHDILGENSGFLRRILDEDDERQLMLVLR